MKYFFYAAMLLGVSYVSSAQSVLPDSANFSTITFNPLLIGRVFFSDSSYRSGKLTNMWLNSVGAPTKMNEYYSMQGGLCTVPNYEMFKTDLCFSDSNFQLYYHAGFMGGAYYQSPIFGFALHYDVCAPNRTRTVAGTTTSYQETYPDWADNSGGAFGFLTHNSGYDSLFADNNKRRVYTPSGTSADTRILTHPYPNDEMIGEERIPIPGQVTQAEINDVYGRILFLSINFRVLSLDSAAMDDTVLCLRIPYTTKPGKGTLSSYTRLIVFDSTPEYIGSNVQITGTMPPTNRGLVRPMRSYWNDTLVITRRMLPAAGNDITFTARFRLMGDEFPEDSTMNGSENHKLWAPGLDPADTSTGIEGRIKRMEPEVFYMGNCSIAIDWVRVETKKAQNLFRGKEDDYIFGLVESVPFAMRYDVRYPNSPNHPWINGKYTGKARLHRIWLLEEDHPRTYHAIGYANHLLGGRGSSETGYVTFWPTREFDENGNAVEIAPGSVNPDSARYRAVQTRYYTEHYARETNFKDYVRGDTYAASANNAVPHIWKSGKDTSLNLGLFSGYFNMDTHKEHYNLGGITYAMMQNNIHYRYQPRWPASSLANIEGAVNRYATDPFMLFDTKRTWISSVWCAPRPTLYEFSNDTAKVCTPGTTCPRKVRLFGSRYLSGEELRFSQWFFRILGVKGQAFWMYRSKAIGADWDDTLRIPDPKGFRDNQIPIGYIGMHTLQTLDNNPPDTVTNLSWYKKESLGSDYFQANDPTLLHLFAEPRSVIAHNHGVEEDKIYFGRKTMRHELKKYQDFCYYYDSLLVRLDLDFWYAKGFRTFNTARNNAKDLFFHRKIDSSAITVKHIYYDTTKGIYTYSSAEPIDSTFFDITMLRDKTKTDTNEFYIGVINRRLDPVFTIKMSDSLSFGSTFADTAISTTKRFCSVPSAEFDSLLTLSSHPLVANKTIHKYCQNGARQISLPFKVRGIDDGDYPLLRIEELGGVLDTVIGCDRPLSLNYQPGEGKIFRVRVQYPDRFTGELPHSNQTKLVSHNIMVYDTAQSKWVEGDSAIYHAVYHKRITGNKTGVYYRVSKPAAMASNTNALQWHSEKLLSDSVYHHGRYNKNDTCAYPSIITRFDSATNEYRAYVVYGCTSPYWGLPLPVFNGQHIVENIIRLRKDSILTILSAMSIDTVHSRVLSDYGTPMINASDTINFYCYADEDRGIIAAWKKPDLNRILLNKTNIHYTDALNCSTVEYDTRHPSMNPYSRYIRGQKENDCALVWQEQGYCIPYYNIFTTRLSVVNGNITYGLSPNYIIPLGYTVLFNFDSTIFCLSAENQTFDTSYSHEFPVHYRELWDADDSSAVCDFEMYYPGHSPTDMRLDRTMWEVRDVVNGGGWFLGGRGNWYRDTLIGGSFIPNEYGVGWRGNLWLSPAFPYTIDDFALDQPSIAAGMAAHYQANPIANWHGCVNSYTQRAMNFNFRSTFLGGTYPSSIYSIPQTHMYPPVPDIVSIIDYEFVEQSHVAARGSVLLNDWWRNHRIYNKTAEGSGLLATPYAPYQIRSSGQHYYRFGDNTLRTLNVVSFGNENGSYGIGTPTLNNRDYTLYPVHSEPQRELANPFADIDTLQTEWFTIDENDMLRYTFSGSNPEQTTVYMERQSDGARWLLPNMPLREYALSSLSIDLYNGNGELYRIVSHGNSGTYFIQNTALASEQTIYGKTSDEHYSVNLNEVPINDEQLSVYPNPTSEKLTIGWSGGKAELQFINSEGNILTELPITGNITLDTGNLPNGLYIVRIQQGTYSVSKTVILMK